MDHAALSALGVIGLTVAVTGMVSKRVRLPPVLLFLVVGALAGPSVLGLVDTTALDHILPVALEVLVAVIVFEGAFSIDVLYLKRVGRVVRNLLTVGVVVTFALASVLAVAADVLPWRTALLFGALVTVTGPTVISPLVRGIHLNERVRAVLLGEGVLVDPIGALLSIVMLDFALSGGTGADQFGFLVSRLVGGVAVGMVGAVAVLAVLRVNRTPQPVEATVLLLGTSVAAFAFAENWLSSSGLAAMAAMGVTLAWRKIPHAEEVRSFEDDLSKMLIGAVYILAVATVDLDVVRSLWPTGVLLVVGLMVLVRPLAVYLSALGSDLTLRERSYIGLIGPRGVVAAALAAFAGESLGPEQSGEILAALVFLTVFLTVAIQSTYAAWLADLLGVKAMHAIIAGAGAVARRVGLQLSDGGYAVTLVDVREAPVKRARDAGLEAVEADATNLRALESAGAERAQLAIAATDSDQVNLLFSQYIASVNPDAKVYARVSQGGAVDTFRAAGIPTVANHEALSQALLDLIEAPLVTEVLGGTGERVIASLEVGSGLNGRPIRDLHLGDGVLILLVERSGVDLVPGGSVILERGDRLLLFGQAPAVHEAREQLIGVA